MRGKVLAWVAGSDSRHLLFFMKRKTLSVFVDESGRFQHPDPDSRFYILGMVLHDQDDSITAQIRDLERAEGEIDIEDHCFHAGPLIRKEKGYEFLNRKFRGRIFSSDISVSFLDELAHILPKTPCRLRASTQSPPRLPNS